MEREQLERRVVEIVAERAAMKAEEILPAHSFINDLGFDSLDVMEMVMELEDEFEVSMPDEDLDRIKTVGDAMEYVRERLKMAGAK